MSYYNRAAGNAEGKMLVYARNYLDKKTYEKVLSANRKAMTGLKLYIVLVLAMLLLPVFLLGKIPMELTTGIILAGCFSPVIYFPLYYTTFGKDWNKYVKWYTKSGRLVPFTYDDSQESKTESESKPKSGPLANRLNAFNKDSDTQVVENDTAEPIVSEEIKETVKKTDSAGIANAKIANIRGSMYSVTIEYDNGYVMEASGELFPHSTFIIYNRSLKKWNPPYDDVEFTIEDAKKLIADVLNEYDFNKVNIVFDGDFSVAELRAKLLTTYRVTYDSGFPDVSKNWIVRADAFNLKDKTVKLGFYKGHLPDWKVEDKAECSKIVNLDEVSDYKVIYTYIYVDKTGKRTDEYKRIMPCDYDTFIKIITNNSTR